MTARGPYEGRADEPLFVGWAPAPAVDRRFLFASVPALLGAAAAGGFGLARALGDPGAGEWKTGATETVTGVLVSDPYPVIRVADPAAPSGVRTWLVVAEGKCTGALQVGAAAQVVTARGVKIARGDRRMLEVPLLLDDWLTPQEGALPAAPTPVSLGRARLAGMIMDSKCFFGVMRPARGRTHKACASLCIRGGIPPSLQARRADGTEAVLLMTDAGGNRLGDDILPFVADPVEATGELVRVGDIVQFRADAGAYRRV